MSNVTSSEILISHNVFNIQSSTPGSVSTGIGIAATFAGGSRCQILSNNFEAVTVLGIYLGPKALLVRRFKQSGATVPGAGSKERMSHFSASSLCGKG